MIYKVVTRLPILKNSSFELIFLKSSQMHYFLKIALQKYNVNKSKTNIRALIRGFDTLILDIVCLSNFIFKGFKFIY